MSQTQKIAVQAPFDDRRFGAFSEGVHTVSVETAKWLIEAKLAKAHSGAKRKTDKQGEGQNA